MLEKVDSLGVRKVKTIERKQISSADEQNEAESIGEGRHASPVINLSSAIRSKTNKKRRVRLYKISRKMRSEPETISLLRQRKG
jgi:hypothetical protein